MRHERAASPGMKILRAPVIGTSFYEIQEKSLVAKGVLLCFE